MRTTTTVKQATVGKKLTVNSRSSSAGSQLRDSDGSVLYWMKQLDDYRRTKKELIFGMSYHHLGLMVRMFLAAHLAASKLIEDCRDGLPGDQVKLVPTSPDHPSRKFRIIQLWDKKTGTVMAAPDSEEEKTVLTQFIKQDMGVSTTRRWLNRRPSPLKVELVEEARKLAERWRKILEKVRQYRERFPAWQCDGDDGLDPLPGESVEHYEARVKPLIHQKW